MGKHIFTGSMLVLTLSATTSVFANQAFDAQSPWMLGDWSGKRSALVEQGYDFSIGYSGQGATLLNTSVDSDKDAAYADQWNFSGHFDLAKILNWDNTQAYINITKRDGNQIENKSNALSTHISQVQEVYGRGQTWRLTDMWIKKTFMNNQLDLKVGRFGQSEDFASFDCEFQNLALCGGQIGHWSGDQWFNGPVSQWAARVKWSFSPELAAQIGAYEVNPENLKRSKGFNLSTDGSEGAIIPVELIWTPALTLQHLPGEYRLGYYYSTVNADNIQTERSGNKHKYGIWISAKQQLTTHTNDASRGLSIMGQVALYDNKTSIFQDAENIALVYKGLAESRAKDEIGLGLSRISVDSDRAPELDEELNAELYYAIQATNWLKIRPNLQYVKNIGANPESGNAWAAGVKFNMNF
ncbi:carbohydrate porin [Acinetobacter qingfengensis]|uniref:Porin n=1 Tax=Acinetobacter qingfengensis TaxID=1262585 RepID=A0A1E7R3E3_9GAMM|nr:carbohydrate porin [Acinetobacter qingfengensis]KAA8734699.1 carbohydrate porin [Acinetobacter qingfengensis]OEY93792.1 porin [Acinetobacter qingfengensis]